MSGHEDQAAGKAKELGGRLTGDDQLEADGQEQHAAGKAREAVDESASKAKGAVEGLKEAISDR